MSTASRGTKAYGGTAYQSGKVLLASELEGDFNPVYNAVNGNLEDDNVKSGAGIDPAKIDDYSANDTESLAVVSPGESASPAKATTLEGELSRLRYSVERLGIGFPAGAHALRHGSTGPTVAGWIDAPARGANLLWDGSFEGWSSASALISWSAVGAPTLARTATPVSEGAGYCVRVTSAAASAEGVSQTLAGLRASTRYLVTARARLISGGASAAAMLEVTGADAASEYRSVTGTDATTTSATFVTLSAIVKTDATPTSLVVRCLTNAVNPCVVEFDHVSLYELQEALVPQGGNVVNRHQLSAAKSYTATVEVDTDLSVAVRAPGPGYQIVVSAELPFICGGGGGTTLEARLKENGAYVQVVAQTVSASFANTCVISYALLSPTPGTTYTYTLFGHSNITTSSHYTPAAGTAFRSITATLLRCG